MMGTCRCKRSGLRGLASAMGVAGATVAVMALPSLASAGALPDGRTYEQVSEEQKNGNEAGIVLNEGEGGAKQGERVPGQAYSLPSPDGERVVFYQLGPAGQTSSGTDLYSVATRGSDGWTTRAALPPGYGENSSKFEEEEPKLFIPSHELTRFLFDAAATFQRDNPQGASSALYRAGEEDPLSTLPGTPPEAEWWISRPALPFSEARPQPGDIRNTKPLAVGGTPDFSTVYFDWRAVLVPEDAPRASHMTGGYDLEGPPGFYEWHEGTLRSAGILPNEPGEPGYDPKEGSNEGAEDPYGAVPAASSTNEAVHPTPQELGNEVSEDGARAFFVSPGPLFANEAGTPTELYVREQTADGPRTVLVSRDELKGGEPAPGSGSTHAVTPYELVGSVSRYVYAAPDGSRAFFQSMDKLADAVGGEEPVGSGPWTYEFDAETGKLAYLPGVNGPILVAGRDGSSLLFLHAETITLELEEEESHSEECEYRFPIEVQATTGVALWQEGEVRPVADWSGQEPSGKVCIGEGSAAQALSVEELLPGAPSFAQAVSDGSAFLFATRNRLEGTQNSFNDASGTEQLYLYQTGSKSVRCVSCAPQGSPSLKAQWSLWNQSVRDGGRRVFFATASRLASGAINGVADVYEWEQAGTGGCATEEAGGEGGCRYLISPGTSPQPAFYLGSSESGDDVFFATAEGIAPNDTDGAYDVYDARIGGGFPAPPPSTTCTGGCRLVPAPPALAAPVSVAVGPTGNIAPSTLRKSEGRRKVKARQKAGTRKRELAKALKKCGRKHKSERARCKRRARRHLGAKTSRHRRDDHPGRRDGRRTSKRGARR